MSDTASNVEIEDVLASVRRLVSAERKDRSENKDRSGNRRARPSASAPSPAPTMDLADRLVLTADLRVAGGEDRVGSRSAAPVDAEVPDLGEGEAEAGQAGDSPAKDPRDSASATVEEARMLTLEERIAQLEAAVVTHANADFEPDGSEDQTQHRPTRILGLRPQDHGAGEAAAASAESPVEEPPVASPREADDGARARPGGEWTAVDNAARPDDASAEPAAEPGVSAGGVTDVAEPGEENERAEAEDATDWQEVFIDGLPEGVVDAAGEPDPLYGGPVMEMFQHRSDGAEQEGAADGTRPLRFPVAPRCRRARGQSGGGPPGFRRPCGGQRFGGRPAGSRGAGKAASP